ncbi:MAG: hypothetical protein WCK49_06430 [Myxococcaceae bacterium]
MARLIGLILSLTLSGSALATIGDACQSNDDCGKKEHCILEFNQGYCAQFDCSEETSCSSNAKCMAPDASFTVCLKKCSKNSDCRTGYRCYEQGVCLP